MGQMYQPDYWEDEGRAAPPPRVPDRPFGGLPSAMERQAEHARRRPDIRSEQYKPKWWHRLLAGGVAGTEGYLRGGTSPSTERFVSEMRSPGFTADVRRWEDEAAAYGADVEAAGVRSELGFRQRGEERAERETQGRVSASRARQMESETRREAMMQPPPPSSPWVPAGKGYLVNRETGETKPVSTLPDVREPPSTIAGGLLSDDPEMRARAERGSRYTRAEPRAAQPPQARPQDLLAVQEQKRAGLAEAEQAFTNEMNEMYENWGFQGEPETEEQRQHLADVTARHEARKADILKYFQEAMAALGGGGAGGGIPPIPRVPPIGGAGIPADPYAVQ